MSTSIRRSLLYVPASIESMVRKVGARGADVVILDLEDGVVPEAKDSARELAERALTDVDFAGAEVMVRANHPTSPWGGRDLEMVTRARPAGLVIPKVEDANTVRDVDQALATTMPLHLMLETVRGVAGAPEIAGASPRVASLVFGAADYRESLRGGPLSDELELLFARCQITQAARGAGIEAYDTPWFEYRDTGGLKQSAFRVRQLGFDGKTAVHPVQVPVINEVFAPTREEIERAQAIVEAMTEALKQGRYVATVGGEMVEALHLRGATRTLDRAFRLGLTDSPPASVEIPGA